ncbi:iron complex transport system permease protein [Stackebrandtia albiflava]|uniref:Iron complex transport system permease protein n=1 Tax=Stackebrandtia albiflava TaxID=406432 RepID=A0A562VBN5_9ACTN|nr:iron ABC transporter permease [Stackebrandtia albiflava]TWJ15304.1 iron complex transport system permease protein [Stackebrandtia albiflava]
MKDVATRVVPDDPLGTRSQRRRSLGWITGLTAGLIATVCLTIGIGPVWIPPDVVLGIVGDRLLDLPPDPDRARSDVSIVLNVRIPRVLLGVAVGAGLAMCGAVLQAMVRNMLADPYILGISGGASVGAAGAILFGLGAGIGLNALPVSAFLGALGAALLVFFIARAGGQITSLRLLLSGVAVGYALSAVTSFIIFASDSAEGSRSVMFWLLGSLSLARWDPLLLVVLVVVGLALLCFILWGRRLDAIAIGDETALTLGVSPTRTRVVLLVFVSLATGAVVAAAGAIGFVGLVIPHIARRLVGSPHTRVIPVAALIGAVFLVWADAAARTVMQPRELPIGIITAMVGAPFLLFLVRRMYARRV